MVHIVLNAKTNRHRGDRPKKFVNCRQKLQTCKKEIMFSTQKKVLEGIAGEKKVQGIYVQRTKKVVGGKKEIVCPAPKQWICKNCPCTRHTHIEPPVLYPPLDRAKRVHYVSVKVKLRQRWQILTTFIRNHGPDQPTRHQPCQILCVFIFSASQCWQWASGPLVGS